MRVGQPMRILSRSILAISCLVLLLTVGGRLMPVSLSSAPPPSVTEPTAPTTAGQEATTSPAEPEVVVPGPAVVTTKCREKGRQLVCHTYLAPSSGVILDRSREHVSTAAPWQSVP